MRRGPPTRKVKQKVLLSSQVSLGHVYKEITELGRGSFGRILLLREYVLTTEEFVRFTAGKVLIKSDQIKEDDFVKENEKEATIHKTLTEGATRDVIPKFIETIVENGITYQIMELINGGTLFDLL